MVKTRQQARRIPPSMADYLVLRTVAAILDHYMDEPDMVAVAEVTGNKQDMPLILNTGAFMLACQRLKNELDLRAANLFQAEEQFVASIEREN